jgi:polyhydroxyalkanoate synthesis regulator phasin
MAGKRAKPARAGRAFSHGFATLHRVAERRLRNGWEDIVEMLPPGPRKAVKRLSAEVERVRQEWLKRSDRMVGDARKRAKDFAKGAEKRVRKSLDPLCKRIEQSVEPMQKRLEKSIKPLMTRLDVASRKDIERLQRRLQQLERRVESHGHHASPSA